MSKFVSILNRGRSNGLVISTMERTLYIHLSPAAQRTYTKYRNTTESSFGHSDNTIRKEPEFPETSL